LKQNNVEKFLVERERTMCLMRVDVRTVVFS